MLVVWIVTTPLSTGTTYPTRTTWPSLSTERKTMRCPHLIEQSDPPQIGLCPLWRACECARAVEQWLLTTNGSRPPELEWWEENGDL